MKKKWCHSIVFCLMGISSFCHAGEENNNVRFDLGIGVGVSSNIYYAEKHSSFSPLPVLNINFANFYINSISEIGYEYPFTDNFSAIIFVNPLDGFELKPKDLLPEYRTIKKRHSQVAFGAGFNYYLDGLGVTDTAFSFTAATGKRGGNGNLTLSKTFNISDKLTITPNIGASYFPSKYTNYYFGITDKELGGNIKSVYKPKASYTGNINISSNYALTENIGIALSLGWDKYSNEIKKSPFVKYDSQINSSLSLYYSF